MAWGSIKSDNWIGYGWVLLWLWFLIHPTDSLSLNASERSKSWTGKKLRFDVFSIRDCMGKTCPNTVRFNIIVVFYMSWTSSLALTMLVVNATGAANAAVADGFSQFHPIPHDICGPWRKCQASFGQVHFIVERVDQLKFLQPTALNNL